MHFCKCIYLYHICFLFFYNFVSKSILLHFCYCLTSSYHFPKQSTLSVNFIDNSVHFYEMCLFFFVICAFTCSLMNLPNNILDFVIRLFENLFEKLRIICIFERQFHWIVNEMKRWCFKLSKIKIYAYLKKLELVLCSVHVYVYICVCV